jgi:hypothetical protein
LTAGAGAKITGVCTAQAIIIIFLKEESCKLWVILLLFIGDMQESLMKERAEAAARQSSKTRKAPTCRTCGKPRKGHPKGRCLNQPEQDNIAV